MVFPQVENFELARKLGLDIAAMTESVRHQLMRQLFTNPPDRAEQIIRAAVVDFGGTLMEPSRAQAEGGRISNWGPFDYQLHLLDCSGTGGTFPELAADWAKAAWRMTPPDRDKHAA